jgi:hypothetical protein
MFGLTLVILVSALIKNFCPKNVGDGSSDGVQDPRAKIID